MPPITLAEAKAFLRVSDDAEDALVQLLIDAATGRLEAATGLPVVVENDGNIAAWGEYRFGAGRGTADLVLVTVGTGIGGGIVINGGLFRGSHGVAGA